MTPVPHPPCTCAECAGLRDALAAIDLPTALVHDDGRPVLVKVGDAEITAAEAWCRVIAADPDTSPFQIDRAQKLLRKIHGRTGLDDASLRDARELVTRMQVRAA
jgi:hypothetical protein